MSCPFDPKKLAADIFKGSTEQLMAHSIRAAESFIYDYRRKASFSPDKAHFPFRFNLVKKEYMNGRTSVVAFGPRGARILLRDDQSHNNRRVRIAHEVGHVLLAGLSVKAPDFHQFGEYMPTEDECQQFAIELCTLHDKFYADTNNIIQRCRFDKIP